MRRPRRWIQKALDVRPRRRGYGRHHVKSIRVEAAHKGALHRQLGIPAGEKIPMRLLTAERSRLQAELDRGGSARHLDSVRRQLRRVVFAVTARGFRHKKRSHGRYHR